MVYNVYQLSRLTDGKHQLDGQIDYVAGHIRLRKGLCDGTKRQTLWHEVIHGIATHGRIKMKEDDVDRMASGIIQVLMDNPWLAK